MSRRRGRRPPRGSGPPGPGVLSRPWSIAIDQPGAPDLSDGPLSGIVVVDMTVAIQGPHAGAYLADMGADVIKVERPGGELNRYVHGPGFNPPAGTMGTQFVAMNRGKRGIVVDAHSERRPRGHAPAAGAGRRVRHQLPARGPRAHGARLRGRRRPQPPARLREGVRVRAARPRRRQGDARRCRPGPLRAGRHLRSGRRPADAARRGDRRSHRRHAARPRDHDRAVRAGADRPRPGGLHVVARRDDVDPVVGDHPHHDERRDAAARGPAQPEHPLPLRGLRDEGRRRLHARRGHERRVVGCVLVVRGPPRGGARATLEQRRQADRGTRGDGRRGGDPRSSCGRRSPAARRRSGRRSSRRSRRSSTNGSRTTTSCSRIRRSRRTATSPRSTCRRSDRPASSPTSSTSATRPAAARAGRRRCSASTPRRSWLELGFGRDEIDGVVASGAGAADLILAAIFDD